MKLLEVCSIIPGYAFKSDDFGKGECIAVKIKDIIPPYIDLTNADNVSFIPDEKYQLSEGDFVMAMTGATIGKVGRMKDKKDKVFINQRVCKFVPKSNCDKDYLYYVLNQHIFQKFILNNVDNKLAQPNIGHPTIYKFEHKFPNKSMQQAISKILVCIDKKIAINHSINQNLEAMAKQLYDYWFVQFDFPDENGRPYKSSGGEMIWNDKLKREIPKNWSVLQLDKLCSFRNGINYAKDEIGEPFPIVNVRNISSSTILLDSEDFDVITVPVKKAENYILTDKDIIIARSGCPGSTRLLQNSQKTLFCGFIICCTPYDSYMRYFLTYVLKGLEGSSATTSGGSILQNVSQDTLKSLWVAVPRIDLLKRFNKIIDNLLKQMCTNLQTSKELIKQRDELLPLLMNGQVSLNSDL